jgi:hypothetical protein
MTKITSFAAAALLLAGCFAALAQNDPGQTLPKAEPAPVAKGTTPQLNCVEEDNKHMGEGHHLFFRIAMTNKCEQRLKCQIFVAAYSSKGASIGRTTLVLAAKSKGAPPQTFDFKVKGPGGMTSSSRECRVF